MLAMLTREWEREKVSERERAENWSFSLLVAYVNIDTMWAAKGTPLSGWGTEIITPRDRNNKKKSAETSSSSTASSSSSSPSASSSSWYFGYYISTTFILRIVHLYLGYYIYTLDTTLIIIMIIIIIIIFTDTTFIPWSSGCYLLTTDATCSQRMLHAYDASERERESERAWERGPKTGHFPY